MKKPNDPAGGRDNDSLSAHHKLLAGLNNPVFAVLNISAVEKVTIAEDNAALHQTKTATDNYNAKAHARSTTQLPVSAFPFRTCEFDRGCGR